MTFRKNFCLTALLALFFISTTPAVAQDLLARQAPVDLRVKAVDTLALQRIIERELAESESFDLYDTWDNSIAHRATPLPETFTIDLRGFHMPTQSRALTSNFGHRWGRAHKGLDIKVYVGDTIRAAFDGKVRIVKYEKRGYGKYIIIRHNNGLETVYGHLSKQLVKVDEEVKAGDVIGLGGNTGRSTGSHLHFETRLCGVALNPALLFDFREQDVTGDFYEFNRNTYEDEGREATRLRGVVAGGRYTPEMVNGTSVAGSSGTKSVTSRSGNSSAKYHKVQKGETLASIARRRGTTVDKICRLNKIKKTTTLKVGKILRYS